MTPTGSSSPGRSVRARRSAQTVRIAPHKAATGTRGRCGGPIRPRAVCGTTSPTNPMMPDTATATAVRSAASASVPALNRSTSTPTERAVSSPKEKASSPAPRTAKRTIPISANGARMATWGHSALLKRPISHSRILRCSSPASASSRVISAHRNDPATIPASRNDAV